MNVEEANEEDPVQNQRSSWLTVTETSSGHSAKGSCFRCTYPMIGPQIIHLSSPDEQEEFFTDEFDLF